MTLNIKTNKNAKAIAMLPELITFLGNISNLFTERLNKQNRLENLKFMMGYDINLDMV